MQVDLGAGLSAGTPGSPGAVTGSAASAFPTEPELVQALVGGQAGALEALYDRHGRAVFSLALHLLSDRGAAEEVVQETFLKLWRRPAAYQPERGHLLPWLLGVAHHHAIDLLRRRRLERRHGAPSTVEPDGQRFQQAVQHDRHVPGPEVYIGHAEQRRAVLQALAELPENQRVPLELAYYRGLTQVEIARHLGEPLGTVKTRMRLGLLRLRSAPVLAELWSNP